MAERSLPSWKQVFDSIERRVGPRIDEFARSEEFAALAALNKRSQTELTRRLEQVSRRALHVMNLPAGSDMNRLLTHIAHLEREVRDLRKEVTDRNDAEFLASLSARRSQTSMSDSDSVSATKASTSATPTSAKAATVPPAKRPSAKLTKATPAKASRPTKRS
jgi:hypothetical protein